MPDDVTWRELEKLRIEKALKKARSMVGSLANLGKTIDLEYKFTTLAIESKELHELIKRIKRDFKMVSR